MSSKRINNQKIGRPPSKAEQLGFKEKFEKHKVRFELESQLLVYIYNVFHSQECEQSGNHNMITAEQLKEVFEYFNMLSLYQLLLNNNKEYYDNQVELDEKQKSQYTCALDIRYLFKIIKKNKTQCDITSQTLNNYEIFLTFVFYLYNEKLVNDKFLCFFCPRMQARSLINMMFEGPSLLSNDMSLLIVAFLLEVMQKQKIVVQREKVQETLPQVPPPPFYSNPPHQNLNYMNNRGYELCRNRQSLMPRQSPLLSIPPPISSLQHYSPLSSQQRQFSNGSNFSSLKNNNQRQLNIPQQSQRKGLTKREPFAIVHIEEQEEEDQ